MHFGCVRKALLWGIVLLLAALAGRPGSAYELITDSDTLAGLIRAEVARFLPGSELGIGGVKPRLITGEIILSHVALSAEARRRLVPGDPVPWLHIWVPDPAGGCSRGSSYPARWWSLHRPCGSPAPKDGTWNLLPAEAHAEGRHAGRHRLAQQRPHRREFGFVRVLRAAEDNKAVPASSESGGASAPRPRPRRRPAAPQTARRVGGGAARGPTQATHGRTY